MLHSQEIRCSLALKSPSRHRNSMSRHGHVPRSGLSFVAVIWHLSVPLLIIGFHIIHFFEHSLIRTMIAHCCSTFVRNLQWVFHLRHCVENTRRFNSRCPLLDLRNELLPASAWIRPAPSGQLPQRPARPGVPEPSPDRGSGQ